MKQRRKWVIDPISGKCPIPVRAPEARPPSDLLAPVHGWFTEGFDTTDLKEAKSLLDELS